MNHDETKNIIRAICGYYPNYKPVNMAETIDLWQLALEERTYNQIQHALIAYVKSDTSGFAPSVGNLLNLVHSVSNNELGEAEAWSMVSRAIRDSAYHSVERFNELPDMVKQAIGTPQNLREMATSENYNDSVESSNFKRAYRSVIERQRQIGTISPAILEKIKATTIEEHTIKNITEVHSE